MVPGVLVQLGGLRRLRGQRLQRDDLPGPGAEGDLLLLLDRQGELGAVHGLLRLGHRLRLIVRLDLRLGLRQGEPLSFVGRVIEPQVVGIRPVRQVLEGEAKVQQAAAPAPAGQEVRPPLHVHLHVVAVRVQGGQADRLLVARRGMQHRVVGGEPSVEISVPRRDSRIVLRLERPFVDEFLPHTVVRGEIDVLEELSVQHRVDVPGRLPGLHLDGHLSPGHPAHEERRNEG